MRWRIVLSALLAAYTLPALVWVMIVDPGGESGVEEVFALPVLTAATLGLFLTLRRPDNVIGFVISAIGAAIVTLGLTNSLAPELVEAGNLDLAVFLIQFSDLAWSTMFTGALVLLPLWFPTGKPISRRWGWVGRAAIGAVAFGFLRSLLAENTCLTNRSGDCTPLPNPLGIEGFDGFEILPFLVILLAAPPAIASLFVRWRRAGFEEREQLKWFLFAAVFTAFAQVLSMGIVSIPLFMEDVLFGAALTGISIAIAIAILRYRLYEIDRIISRTVTYAVVAGILAIGVALIAGLAGTRFDDPLVVAVTTLTVAAAFNPFRRRVHRIVDRRFNRSRYDAERVVESFTSTLQTRVDQGEIMHDWARVISNTMQPRAMGMWVRQ